MFELRNGYTPSKKESIYWDNGTIPWFRLEDIRKNGRFLFDSIQHVASIAVKSGKLFPANSIIISTTATIGEHALIKVDALTNQQITCLTIRDDYKEKVLIDFAFHYGFVLGEWCRKNTNIGGGLQIIGGDKLKKFRFPIPPLHIQQRIVNVLDNFDAICSDLNISLLAEIKAQQKQYEYYRDKLLNFREKK